MLSVFYRKLFAAYFGPVWDGDGFGFFYFEKPEAVQTVGFL